MLWRFKKSFVNDLDPSSCAPALLGPKIVKPSFSKASTTPATSGASGPTMVRPMPFFLANETRP